MGDVSDPHRPCQTLRLRVMCRLQCSTLDRPKWLTTGTHDEGSALSDLSAICRLITQPSQRYRAKYLTVRSKAHAAFLPSIGQAPPRRPVTKPASPSRARPSNIKLLGSGVVAVAGAIETASRPTSNCWLVTENWSVAELAPAKNVY